jgi:hypothetical protein
LRKTFCGKTPKPKEKLMTLIAVVNQSTLVTNAQVQTMCQAIQTQFDLHCAPAWNQYPPTVTFYTNAANVPGYAWVAYVVDNEAGVTGALGYHEETGDKVVAYIMAEPILSNGGTVMVYNSANVTQYTVSGCLSHELMEMFGDRFAGTFSVGPQNSSGSNLYCNELCDPVEATNYPITVAGVQIAVSNFVFPSWFNPNAVSPQNLPFDYLNQLTAPFTMTSGGYIITATLDNEGEVTARHIFGKSVPNWRKDIVLGKLYRR